MGFFKLFLRSGPKIKVKTSKKDGFSGWIKCQGCAELIHVNELTDNYNCCPRCDYHYRLTSAQRLKLIVDEDSFCELFSDVVSEDPLNFVDEEKYVDRLKRARERSGRDEAVCVGVGTVCGMKTGIAVFDFGFMGGRWGPVLASG